MCRIFIAIGVFAIEVAAAAAANDDDDDDDDNDEIRRDYERERTYRQIYRQT